MVNHGPEIFSALSALNIKKKVREKQVELSGID
jgi:hypothetical protein